MSAGIQILYILIWDHEIRRSISTCNKVDKPSLAYCGLIGQAKGKGLGVGHSPLACEQGPIPEFAPIEHSFAGFRHSFVVPLVHVARQLPVLAEKKEHSSNDTIILIITQPRKYNIAITIMIIIILLINLLLIVDPYS